MRNARRAGSFIGLLVILSAMAVPIAQGNNTTRTTNDSGNQPEPVALIPLRASYSVTMDKGIAINGSAVRSLSRRDDGTWLYQFDVDSFIADIRESVVLRWEAGQVIPLSYRYKLSGLFIKSREQAIDFDWQAGIASGHYRGARFSVELADGVLDPLGYQLQLHQDIRAGKTEMNYTVLDEGDYDQDRFALIGEETITHQGKPMRTVKAEKVRRESSKRETLIWLAPELAYLLVRLMQTEPDGSRYEIVLDDANLRR